MTAVTLLKPGEEIPLKPGMPDKLVIPQTKNQPPPTLLHRPPDGIKEVLL
jgi:hypothetical protein